MTWSVASYVTSLVPDPPQIHGLAEPSFVKHALESLAHAPSDEAEDIIMCSAGSLFSGARLHRLHRLILVMLTMK